MLKTRLNFVPSNTTQYYKQVLVLGFVHFVRFAFLDIIKAKPGSEPR